MKLRQARKIMCGITRYARRRTLKRACVRIGKAKHFRLDKASARWMLPLLDNMKYWQRTAEAMKDAVKPTQPGDGKGE